MVRAAFFNAAYPNQNQVLTAPSSIMKFPKGLFQFLGHLRMLIDHVVKFCNVRIQTKQLIRFLKRLSLG